MSVVRHSVVLLAMTGLLGACHQPAGQGNALVAGNEIVVRSDEQKQLSQMNDLYRAIALKRAIHESGYACQRIDQSRFVGRFKNMDVWAARCNDSKDWALFVGANNAVQVRRCEDTAKVGLPACNLDQKPADKAPAG